MINLSIDENYILDLEDDFIMNEDLDLYEFIGGDPVRAFYLGCNINKWFKTLDKEQRYLYSKQARHNKEYIVKYQNQIEFWSNKFSDKNEVNLLELFEYILNNTFYDNDSDIIKLAFFFGNLFFKKNEENT